MKLSQLIKIRKTLETHAQESIPTALAYKIMKFIKASSEEGAFYNEKFREIIEKYADKDENGKPIINGSNIKIQTELIPECEKELRELEDTEVELPKIKFTVVELSPLKFSVAEMFILDEVIEEQN